MFDVLHACQISAALNYLQKVLSCCKIGPFIIFLYEKGEKPARAARQRSTIDKQIWQNIDPRNCGRDISDARPPTRTDSGGPDGGEENAKTIRSTYRLNS